MIIATFFHKSVLYRIGAYIVWASALFFLFSLFSHHVHAAYFPGNSLYFRSSTIYTMHTRERDRDALRTHIDTVSAWSERKKIALYASMYEYCRDTASSVLREHNGVANAEYSFYVFLQTKLYQYLQEVTTHLRIVLAYERISLDDTLRYALSENTYIRSFFDTLSARYQDTTRYHTLVAVEKSLHQFFAANHFFPRSLEELVTYRFLHKKWQPWLATLSYMPHNYPYIQPLVFSPLRTDTLQKTSRYIVAFPVAHPAYASFFFRDEKSFTLTARIRGYSDWEKWWKNAAYNTPHTSFVWWYVHISRGK